MIRVQVDGAQPWVSGEALRRLMSQLEAAQGRLWDPKEDEGKKGWLTWPEEDHDGLWQEVEATATEIRSRADVAVVVGIGGSYLGARAMTAMLRPGSEISGSRGFPVVFAGYQLSEGELLRLMDDLDDREPALVVVSKSGSTLEPGAVFHLLRTNLERRYGHQARERIYVVTDPERGALREYAVEKGYRRLPIPPDIGGRYSVLTPVGMLPAAVAGIDIRRVLTGARRGWEECRRLDLWANPAILYAAARHLLYLQGWMVEALVTYEPRMADFSRWWQQLFGESQGKDGRGLFPAFLHYTTDLHSMGQFVQQGRRLLFETVLDVDGSSAPQPANGEPPDPRAVIPDDVDAASAYLAGKRLDDLQEAAMAAVMEAHREGGVPQLWIEAKGPGEELVGELVFFFEAACALGGYLLGVDPYDQPGVEAYKRKLKARLLSGPVAGA
ncbi:glucose-6-phosphate isomerase [Kyrpidia spormannii]|uniref:Glucose-6-phosphate isomerase n=1 Tax=Kyrpidia spormannii TaxID=2055160 RepID=A0A2K8NAU6_9BACL|nr:glucose-6-phosphate isomerase [Kyrpidia spormannii]